MDDTAVRLTFPDIVGSRFQAPSWREIWSQSPDLPLPWAHLRRLADPRQQTALGQRPAPRLLAPAWLPFLYNLIRSSSGAVASIPPTVKIIYTGRTGLDLLPLGHCLNPLAAAYSTTTKQVKGSFFLNSNPNPTKFKQTMRFSVEQKIIKEWHVTRHMWDK